MEKKAVIIPAAGSGIRLGSDIPKPFLDLKGKTILQRSIECFLEVEGLVQVIVASSKNYLKVCGEICDEVISEDVSFQVIEGGKERQHSISNAISLLSSDVVLVAIHDAVRPFVKRHYIEECFNIAAECGGAVLGIPAKDTIKRVSSKILIEETPHREHLWQAQTPQVFKKELLQKAYQNALQSNFVGTDDSSLVERIGVTIKMVEGDRRNLKITYPIDLKVAELIISESL